MVNIIAQLPVSNNIAELPCLGQDVKKIHFYMVDRAHSSRFVMEMNFALLIIY